MTTITIIGHPPAVAAMVRDLLSRAPDARQDETALQRLGIWERIRASYCYVSARSNLLCDLRAECQRLGVW
jgi:hypothetical protein